MQTDVPPHPCSARHTLVLNQPSFLFHPPHAGHPCPLLTVPTACSGLLPPSYRPFRATEYLSMQQMENRPVNFMYFTAIPLFDRKIIQHIKVFVIAIDEQGSPGLSSYHLSSHASSRLPFQMQLKSPQMIT